jgi:serine/threonine-protein kinase ULK2
MSRISIKNL